METLMLGVTVVSLLVAFVMSAAAWRLSRQQRARSAARVAALAAAAADVSEAQVSRPVHMVDQGPELVAVGESRSPAPWTTARISPFASSSPRPPISVRPDATDYFRPAAEGSSFTSSEANFSDRFLGSAASTPASSHRQRVLAVVALVLFAAAVVGGYWTVFGDRSHSRQAAIAAAEASPLELVSLRHERRGGRLAVTGLVRNPAAGSQVDSLAAVVFLFDQQGGFITSARANVDFLKLAPGDESPFVINVDAPASVARYRVSFRNDAGIVPHVDRRGQEPIASKQIGGVGR